MSGNLLLRNLSRRKPLSSSSAIASYILGVSSVMIEEPMPKNYRLLKGIVITLGVLIVVMIVILIVASINKYNDQKSDEAALVEKYQTSKIVKSTVTSPFEMDLNLAEDQVIISTSSSDKGILVTIGHNTTAEKIILIDYSGKVVGTINVN